MKYDEFVGQVQQRARLGTSGDAVKAIRATLETLGERLTGDENKDLAAQLPEEIGRYIIQAESDSKFGIDEFFNRVLQKEGGGVDLPEAVYHARVVFEVLQEAVSKGEIDDVRAQLPEEYNRLFEAGSTGQMPRT